MAFKKLSQKELADRYKISEPALKNYELGNRNPSTLQINKIASSLGISSFEISNPCFDSCIGIIYALFYLEEYYGLVVFKDCNKQNNFRFTTNSNEGI